MRSLERLSAAGIPVHGMPSGYRDTLGALSDDEVNALISVRRRIAEVGDVEGYSFLAVIDPSTAEGRFQQKLELVLPALVEARQNVEFDDEADRLYAGYVCTLESVARATGPLLALAREAVRGHHDELSVPLADHLAAAGADGFDADRRLLADAVKAGLGEDALRARQPSASVAAMVGSQYYWVRHHHPVAILGYLAALEAMTPEREMIASYAARIGREPSDLEGLATLTDWHRRQRVAVEGFLATAAVGPNHETLIGTSALQTVHLATEALHGLLEPVGEDVQP